VPEGDTIHRTARSLRAALVGKELRALRARDPTIAHAHLEGRRIVSVEAVGKHLLVRFDDGRTLHSHMRMAGSWHLYRPGERWLRGPHHARIVLETEGAIAVCFDAPTLRLLSKQETDNESATAHLGPDLLAETVDLDEAVRRLRIEPTREIGDALLDQRLVSGIGNIFRAESLFAARIDPFASVGSLDDATLARILRVARRLLHRSVTEGTTPHAVYERAGLPCRRCGTRVRRERQGSPSRTCYFCPKCQHVGGLHPLNRRTPSPR
jgi:endonuclease VIII